jgi:hypothetical protein
MLWLVCTLLAVMVLVGLVRLAVWWAFRPPRLRPSASPSSGCVPVGTDAGAGDRRIDRVQLAGGVSFCQQGLEDPPRSQAAALLSQVLTHELASPCSLEPIEQLAHCRAQEIVRVAIERHARAVVTQVEQPEVVCPCGDTPVAQQRRARALLVLPGFIHVRLRRPRCPDCGAWQSPGQEALRLWPQQRMTRSVEEWLCRFGLSRGFRLAARLVAGVLPGVAVRAKTVERTVGRCAQVVAARAEVEATAAAQDERAGPVPEMAFADPSRLYVGLDGVLVRGRQAASWLEIQVGSLWSAWRKLPDRAHPRREITDATVVARAQEWVGQWPVRSEEGQEWKERLLGYLETCFDLRVDRGVQDRVF